MLGGENQKRHADTTWIMKKFIAVNPAVSAKRKLPVRACSPCRRTKKRCNHNLNLIPSGDAQFPTPYLQDDKHLVSNNVSPGGSPRVSIESEAYVGIEDEYDENTPRTLGATFKGYLNPEAGFRPSINAEGVDIERVSEGVGVWNDDRRSLRRASLSTTEDGMSFQDCFSGVSWRRIQRVIYDEMKASSPTATCSEPLIRYYFTTIHPLFPLLNQKTFEALDRTCPDRMLLVQGICLASSKNYAVQKYLILPGNERPLASKQYGDRIFKAMRIMVDSGMVTNNLILIQAYALMSHFANISGSSDVPSQLCARSVHLSQTIGLHIQARHQGDDERYADTLLCAVWALDRLNAAFHGRPVMMHDRDIGKDLKKCVAQQEPVFQLLLYVVEILDNVISLYRPQFNDFAARSTPEVDFPAFEDLVEQCAIASRIGNQALVTIETLYHAVAILSYRPRKALGRSSASYLRQALSCSLVTSTVKQERKGRLILFPWVPYAASLSLSVAYREMRHNKVHTHRAKARLEFSSCCNVLYELGQIFHSASEMEHLGRRTIAELDRVYTAVTNGARKNTVTGRAHHTDESTGIGKDVQNEVSDPQALVREVPVLAEYQQVSNENEWSTSLGDETSFEIPFIQDHDANRYGAAAEYDLFGMFDPGFNLYSMDDCMEGFLDLSMPRLM